MYFSVSEKQWYPLDPVRYPKGECVWCGESLFENDEVYHLSAVNTKKDAYPFCCEWCVLHYALEYKIAIQDIEKTKF